MKRAITIILTVALLCVGTISFAGGAAKSDHDSLQGTWVVSLGVYADGSLEKELDMQFSFMKSTMTNPMSDGEIAYAIDEKARTITAKDGNDTVWIHYAITDASTMKFIEMRVTTPKGVTQIVGEKGTFKELDLKKKG
jgi:hypothetical protein